MANPAWDAPEVVERWLENRSNGIGSSDSSAICGVNPWKTALEVYYHKLGGSQATGGLSSDAAPRWGHILEPAVARGYELETGRKCHEPLPESHHEHPFIKATADRITDDGERLVEIKTASIHSQGWGESGSDKVPEYYLLQVQHQLAVYRMELADLAVLIGGQDFRVYEIKRDDALIDYLLRINCDFWNNHVLAGIPPEPDWTHSATPEVIGRLRKPSPVVEATLDDAFLPIAEELMQAKEAIKAAKEVEDIAKAKLVFAMESAGTARLGSYLLQRKEVSRKGYVVNPTTFVQFSIKAG